MCFTTNTANALKGAFCHVWQGDGSTGDRIKFEGHQMCWVKDDDWDATTFDNTNCEKQTKDLCGITLEPNTDNGA